MTRHKCVAIVGLPPRLGLERVADSRDPDDALIRAFTGREPISAAAPDAARVSFGGLPIAERELLDALLRHGTYDRYRVIASDVPRQRAMQDDLQEASGDRRLSVDTVNGLRACPQDDVLVHAACSNAFAAISARDQLFTRPTPFHFFLSGLSDPLMLVPSLHALFAAARPYDAITPLTRSNRLTAERLFEQVAAYYKAHWQVRRTFAGRFTDARLGIDTAAFARDEPAREALRQRLGVSPETVVFLYVGRLGASYKADLCPLVQLFARDFVRTRRAATLVLAGYDEGRAADLTQLIAELGCASSIFVIPNVGRREKKRLYDIADVFVSPSDNVQEAFGLTVIEAMAAGLPVVASDWDGYRESISTGVNGFAIKTSWNPAIQQAADACGIGSSIDRHLLYAQNLCVDLAELRAAMQLLAADGGLRRQLGQQARETAARFDWSCAVRALESHWDESLALARDERDGGHAPALPAMYQLDIVETHRHYPTRFISEQDVVRRVRGQTPGDEAESFRLLNAVEVPTWELPLARDLYAACPADRARTIGDVLDEVTGTAATLADRERGRFHLCRLVKYGLLEAHGEVPR